MGTQAAVTANAAKIVSIQLMSPASGDDIVDTKNVKDLGSSFHSINVPSEWGLLSLSSSGSIRNDKTEVSIQLMSPASGDFHRISS